MYSSFTDENADSKIFLILNYKQGIWDLVWFSYSFEILGLSERQNKNWTSDLSFFSMLMPFHCLYWQRSLVYSSKPQRDPYNPL